MKKLCILCLFPLFISKGILAQEVTPARAIGEHLIMLILKNQHSEHAFKSTTLKERLIAKSTYSENGTPSMLDDSMACKYSGSRGSQFDFDNLEYGNTTSLSELNFTEPLVNINYGFPIIKPDMSADTIVEHLYYPDSLANFYYSYDGIGNLISDQTLGQDRGTTGIHHVYFYNVLNQIEKVIAFSETVGVISHDSIFERAMKYNSSNQLIVDSIRYNGPSGWVMAVKYNYYYNIAGDLDRVDVINYNFTTSNAILSQYAYLFSYTTDNKIEIVYQDSGASVLQPMVKDSFSYASGVDFFTAQNTFNWDANTGAWLKFRHLTRHLTSALLPDDQYAEYYYPSGAISVTASHILNYDIYSNPTKDSIIIMYPGANDIKVMYYYYETYSDENTPNVNNTIETFWLYPNPTTESITIANAMVGSQIAIFNITGQKMYGGVIYSLKQTIDIKSLQVGTYMLQITDIDNVKTTKIFVKQ